MSDNTRGPGYSGTPYEGDPRVDTPGGPGGMPLPPQVDYRGNPSFGGQDTPAYGTHADGYDTAGRAEGIPVPPQPDASIRSYDLDDKDYNIMTPLGGIPGHPYSDSANPMRRAGWSPDLGAELPWERQDPRGIFPGSPPPDSSSMPGC